MIKEPISSLGILTILSHRKRLVLISGLLTACVAFAVGRMLPLQYSSEGRLIIENRAAPGDSPASPTVVNGVLTQVDVLQSKGLIRSSMADLANTADLVPNIRLPLPVIKFLTALRDQLTQLWRSINNSSPSESEMDRIVAYVQKHLRVEAKDNSSVISVEFAAGAPDTAATVVNAIMATYLSTVNTAREAEIHKADRWISEQTATDRQAVEEAEQRVTRFVREHHNLSEVQGSLTAAVQLSKDQAQLSLAREELARQQASLDAASHGGGASAPETLASKSIQALKELEAKTLEQMNSLSQSDPRRTVLQGRLNGLRTQINNESQLIVSSILHTVQVERARVQALETTVQKESETAQNSTVAGATLRQLTSDLEAKRQLYVAFSTQAAQMRIAAEQTPTARILFQATPPQRPIRSFGVISLVLGFISGSVGAAAIIAIRSTFGITINSTREIAIATGLPLLGSLPDFRRSRSGNALVPQTQALVTETFRAMWLTMHSSQIEGGTAILVTSSETGEGKTTVATALARRFAEDGFRVLLVDADLHRPRLEKTLNLRPEIYLESVLNGNATLDQATVYHTGSGLHCLPASGGCGNPMRYFASDEFRQLLALGRHEYDFVILDSAPVLHVADPVLLAKLCHYVIFVVEAGRVSGDLVAEAIRRFPEADRNKIYTLLTRVRSTHLDKRDYYSGYA
jgi:capsular exopolysaccharide synthesis family protein